MKEKSIIINAPTLINNINNNNKIKLTLAY